MMTRIAWAVAVGALLTASVGCYAPRPYYPRYPVYPGYQSYPAVPSRAVPATPGGSYTVPGGTVPGTLGTPSVAPSPGGGPTLAPPTSGGASSPPSTYEPGASGGPVPNYPGLDNPTPGDIGTSNDGYQPPEKTPFMKDSGVMRPRENRVAQGGGEQQNYFAELAEYSADAGNPSSSATERIQPVSGEAPVHEAFAAARSSTGASPTRLPVNAGRAARKENWYGYDQAGYQWLRGVVNYDPNTREWIIIYGLPPEPGDQYGGALTLANHPVLRTLRNNDVVQVWGRIAPRAGHDIQGKPYYQIEKLKLLGRYQLGGGKRNDG